MDSGTVLAWIGIIVGILGFAVGTWGVILTRRQQNRRGLSYQISTIPVVTVNQELRGTVQVGIGGEDVENGYLVILKIWNSGKESDFIRIDDFLSPIKIYFGGAKVLGLPEILRTEPEELQNRVSLRCDENNESVILGPLLLNSNDSIEWKVLLNHFNGGIKLEGIIAGIKKFTEVGRPDRRKELITHIFINTLRYVMFHKSSSLFRETLHKELESYREQ